MNTFHYQIETTPDPALDYRLYLDALKDKLALPDTGLIATLNALWPTNAFMKYMRIQPIYAQRLRYAQYILGVDGTAVSVADTANVAMSIRRNGEVIGPMGVGRVQIPLCRDWCVAGYVDLLAIADRTSAFIAAMTTSQITTIPTASWVPVLFGVSLNPENPYVNITPCYSGTPEDTVRVMRRRTVRLGE